MEIDPALQAILDRRMIAAKRSDVVALRRCANELAQLGTEEGELLSIGTHGVIANIAGDFKTAVELLTQALHGHQRSGNTRWIAGSSQNLANAYRHSGDLARALELYHQALDLFQQIDEPMGLAMCSMSVAALYRQQGHYPEAIEQLQRAMRFFEDQKDDDALSLIYGNLSGCYLDVGEYDLASTYMYKSLDIRSTIDDPIGLAKIYHALGSLSAHLRDTTAALEWYTQALEIYRTSGDQHSASMCHAHIGGQYVHLHRYDDAERVLLAGYDLAKQSNALPMVLEIAAQLCDVYGSLNQLDKVDEILERHADDWPKNEEHHAVSLRIRGELCRERGQYDEAQAFFERVLEYQHRTGRRSRESGVHGLIKQIARLKGDFDLYLKHQEAEQAIESEIRSDDLKKKLAVQSKQREIDSAQQEAEKHRALLYGALPREIADRMLAGEDVSGDHYDHSSVLFLDIVGFTHLSSTIPANEVVRFLDGIFLACDRICAQHGVTKIKTIGDSYMAVAFPSAGAASSEHRIANVAREIQQHEFMAPNGAKVLLRIGVHSGPVVAGVIGSDRLQYDVWGDTVNVASRMESTCEPGRIHVSEAFASAYRADLELYAAGAGGLSPRGTIEVKGRGRMSTWWLERA